MVRIVKISIGSNHNPEADLEAIVTSFWAHLPNTVQYTVGVGEDRTVVAFFTEDDSLQLMENVPESIAGVDNVKSEELTPEQYGGDEGIKILLCIESDQSDTDDTSDSAEQSEENDDDDPTAKSDPADLSEDVVDEDDISDDDDEKSS